LPVDYASHCAHVDVLRTELEQLQVTPGPGRVPFYSTVSPDETVFDAGYWFRNLRQPVRFHDAVTRAVDDGLGLFVEVSPHPALLAAIEDTGGTVVGSLRRDQPGPDTFLTNLAQAHTYGADLDWATLNVQPGHVDLPTYPFQQQRYWPVAARVEADSLRYRIEWKPIPAAPGGRLPGSWVVIAPDGYADDPWLAACARGLAAAGAHVTTGAADGAFDGVVSLLAVDERPHPEQPAVSAGLAATLALLNDPSGPAPVWLVTRAAVTAGEDRAPGSAVQAQTWGLGRVAGLEQPQRCGGVIDLPGDLDEDVLSRLIGVLGGTEDQVAIRSTGVFARRLVPAALGTAGRHYRPTGTVLVTGGFGAIGGHVARWLARRGAGHLVLIGRRGADTPGAAALHAELRATGAEVTMATCDVADRTALEMLLAGLDSPVRAVFHAAGTLRAESLAETTVESLAEAYAAKVTSAEHLDHLFRDADLDAFVLFSSGSGVWGSAGHGAYAAANAHLDALAQRRAARGLHALAVSWGLWEGDGMAAGTGANELRRRGIRAMSPDIGVTALQQALDRDEPAVTVADIDWERFAAVFTSARPRPLLDDIPAARPAPGTPRPQQTGLAEQLAHATETDRQRLLLDLVREHAAAALGHARADAVEPDRAFRDVGFDSLTAVSLRNRLNAATGLRLPATLVFDHSTPLALAAFLRSELAVEVTPELKLPDQLDLVEKALATGDLGGLSAATVVKRLRGLLARLDERPTDGGGTARDLIDAADDDELLAFINQELGR
ncbi:type I polyketide synthase, partial [Micromonospora sp. DT201]|uniref:beta-ketoacyl reductase n=1 Tax=Micromonospora sp. DT201 TaxID=3393442 RepID=UPI003CEF04DE